MSTFTTYRCDKCGAEQDTPDQFWTVAVNVQSIHHPQNNAMKRVAQEWCRKCVEGAHLLPPVQHKKEGVDLPEQPTLDEIVRDIVRDEIAGLTGAP